MNQRHIHEPFVLAAIGIALTAGFGYPAVIIAFAGIVLHAICQPMRAFQRAGTLWDDTPASTLVCNVA